jgi:hypothetical protein
LLNWLGETLCLGDLVARFLLPPRHKDTMMHQEEFEYTEIHKNENNFQKGNHLGHIRFFLQFNNWSGKGYYNKAG